MVIFNSYVKLPEGNIAIEHGNRNSGFTPLKIGICHGYVNVYQRLMGFKDFKGI